MHIRLLNALHTILLILAVTGSAVAQTVSVTDDISTDETWTSDNTYILDGLIFVDFDYSIDLFDAVVMHFLCLEFHEVFLIFHGILHVRVRLDLFHDFHLLDIDSLSFEVAQLFESFA